VSGLVTQAILALAAVAAFLLLALQTRRLKHARADAAASRAALLEMEVTYDQAPLGLTVLDRELRYLRTNQMLAEQNGLSAQEHLGKSIHDIVPEVAGIAGPIFQGVMRTGEPLIGLEFEAQTAAHPGEVRAYRESVYPVRDTQGRIFGVSVAVEDITERKQLLTALHASEQELERQARNKDEFLAVLAHELRNPLASIQAGLELLKLNGADVARQARTHDIMGRQMAHMVRLIDDLLDVARISSGKLELEMDTVCVGEIVDAAIELCRGEIERAGHRFHAELPPAPLYVHADRVRLTEVISNLLHNAAKYTPAGGEIGLSVSEDDGQVLFRVTDNGIGIARENLAHVFTMFAQAERARAHRQGGLGVGLGLARRIVELHGGAIAADSEGPGKGSTFSVRLAAVQGAPAAGLEPPAARPAAQGALRILVLDDNVEAAGTLGALLEAHGHAVRLAGTGMEALDKLAEAEADIAILDIGLPDISGYEVARRIRERDPQRAIFIVALSGWGSGSDRRQSEQAGIDVHLTKPVTMATIEDTIRACRERRGQVDGGTSAVRPNRLKDPA
jgi:PAS domain S-box-containing protein